MDLQKVQQGWCLADWYFLRLKAAVGVVVAPAPFAENGHPGGLFNFTCLVEVTLLVITSLIYDG